MGRSVSKKLWGGFGAILVLLVIVGALSFWTAVDMNSRYQSLLNEEVKKVDIVDEFILKQIEIQNDVRGYMLYKEEKYLDSRIANIERSHELLAELDKMIVFESVRNHYEALEDSMKTFEEIQEGILSNSRAGKESLAINLGKTSSNVGNIVLDRAEMIKDAQHTIMEDKLSEIKKVMNGVIIFDIGLIVFSLIVGIIISTVISRSIARPVKVVTEGLNSIAAGDFSIDPLVVKNKDEIGEMATAFNKMGGDVANMIRHISDSTMQLAAQSEELSASSQESLASSEMVAKTAESQLTSSEQQKQITEQAASSMTELTLGVSEIATNNEQMLHSAEAVSALVIKGSDSINEVSNQMGTIHSTIRESSAIMEEMESHSNEIQKVTSLITGIAEQTNLLALNAAIEAARAGESGKGFAVVAEEVRHLAEQSKTSASEIATMVSMIQQASKRAVLSISSGSARVDEGINATQQSHQVFQEIQGAVGDVAEKIETVSAAIEEIQAMADEVMRGSGEIRELSIGAHDAAADTSAATEEQLAVSQEISDSSYGLAKLAEDLQQELSRFRV